MPDRFGLISFGEKPVKLEAISFDIIDKGEVSLALEAVTPKEIKVSSETIREGISIFTFTETISLEAEEPIIFTFPLSLEEPGVYSLSLDIAVVDDNTWYEITFPFRTWAEGLVSVAYPSEKRERVLHLALNTVQHCLFVLANHSKEAITSPRLVVSVPKGIEILNPEGSFHHLYYNVSRWEMEEEKRAEGPYLRYTFFLDKAISPGRIEKTRFFRSLLLFFRIAEGSHFIGGESLPVFYRLESDKGVEEENKLHLVLLPPVEGEQPHTIKTHIWLWTLNPGPYTWAPLIETYRRIGVNAVEAGVIGDRPEYVEILRAANIASINNMWWYWWYPEHLKEHPQHAAINFQGEIVDDKMVCPTILLQDEGALLKESLERLFKLVAKGVADGFHWNLEGPPVWQVCFCERCLNEFRKFASIADEENLTPRLIRRQYALEWIKFACRQSSMACKFIRDEIHRINPEATFGFYSGRPSLAVMEKYRVNWEEAVRYIDIAYPSYYSASPSHLDHTFVAGMKELMARFREDAAPNLIRYVPTLTTGYGRVGCSVNPSPELTKLQILRSIASGADGVSFWWWGPFDGKFYHAFAEATSLISDFEEFFLQGKEKENLISLGDHPYGKSVSVANRVLGNSSLIMLFNHRPKDRKLNLSIPDIPEGSVGYFYPELRRFNPHKEIRVKLEPLGIKTLVVEPKNEIEKLISSF